MRRTLPARSAFAFAFPLLVCLHARGARADDAAQPSSSASVERRSNVEITIVGGDPENAQLLEDTLRELFARLGLNIARRGPTAPSTFLAVVDVNLSPRTDLPTVDIRVWDAERNALVAERSLRRDGSAAITREEIAHAIRSIVEAKLLPDTQARTPPPAAPIVREPERETARDGERAGGAASSAVALDVVTFGAGGLVGSGAGPVGRIGLGASIASRRGVRPSVGVTVAMALPFESNTDLLSAHTTLLSARAMPGLGLFRTPGFSLDAMLGGGVDIFTVTPRSTVLPESTVGSPSTRADPVMTPGLFARVALTSSVFLTAAATADIDLVSRTYVIENGHGHDDVLSVWRVRPLLALGFGFTALGDTPFAPEPASAPSRAADPARAARR